MFKNKILLVTGGTGSFGKAIISRFINTEIGEIRVFSRDEKKQDDIRKIYNNNKLKLFLGDVRDISSVEQVMKNVDYVFHAAALKQVPSCEFFPIEAVKTNIFGTENVIQAAIKNYVQKVVCLSTDKAVYPVNAMGLSKALMEKIAVANSRNSHKTIITVTRYGNVMGSRGSVIPLFLDQIKNNKPISITDLNMTRFMMDLNEAIELVLYAFEMGDNGDIFVQKSPAASINVLVKAILNILNKKNYPTINIGVRHGEKLYETLISAEEYKIAIEESNFYRIKSDNRDLNYSKFYENGLISSNDPKNANIDYNSNNTRQLTVEELSQILRKLDFFRNKP